MSLQPSVEEFSSFLLDSCGIEGNEHTIEQANRGRDREIEHEPSG